jgi:hypothetical protein
MVKKVNPEEKQKQFDDWHNGPEGQIIENWVPEVDKQSSEVKGLDNAYVDIIDDWQPILNFLFKVCETMKVPGRKAKCKLQKLL